MNAATPKLRTVPVPPEVVAVLEASTVSANLLVLPPDLERKLYEKTNRVLEVLGGTWNRRVKGHIFAACATADEVRALIASATEAETASVVDRKKTLEFFCTPPMLAMKMANWAVRQGASVLEPSAGDGRLVGAAVIRGASSVHCVEIDEQNCASIRKIYSLENIRHYGAYVGVACRDFLAWEPRRGQRFRAAIMNPPLSRNQDIAHILHAARFIEPGGRLAAVLSPHGFFAEDKPSQAFRAWLGTQDHEVENLPEKTFSAEGTDVQAKLLFLQLE